MNFEYPNQIKALLNLLNENYSGYKYENGVEDPLFYINEPKIFIKFINSDYVVKKVNIPKTITLYDLYTIANLYKLCHISNILLIHKNRILNRDESSIDFNSDNDNIIIIEPKYFPDDYYYNSLLKKKSSNILCNVFLTLSNGQKFNKVFPNDITIGEASKAFILILGLSIYHYFILPQDFAKIGVNDKRKLKEFDMPIFLEVRTPDILGSEIKVLGKQIKFTIHSNDEKFFHSSYVIGILNKIEDIMKYYEPTSGRMLKKIKIGQLEIKREEDKRLCSLLSLGITKDFDCLIEFGEIWGRN